MAWWIWIALGLALAAIELATPGGFFIVFFGIAAFVVGVLDLAGLAQRPAVQWLLFTILAVVALRLFRRPLLGYHGMAGGRDDVDSLVGAVAVAAGAILPGGHGRAELRGTMWSARNVGAALLAAGQRCRVVAVEGLTLDITPE
jgi:membrane protein implicated in regulation of membrane protease activity